MPIKDKTAYFTIRQHGGEVMIRFTDPLWELICGIERPNWAVNLTASDKKLSIKPLKKSLETLVIGRLHLGGRVAWLDDDELTSIANMNSLEILDISGTEVSDASIPMLASMKKLWYILATDTKMTEQAVIDFIKLRDPKDGYARGYVYLYVSLRTIHSDTEEMLRTRPIVFQTGTETVLCSCSGSFSECPFRKDTCDSESGEVKLPTEPK
jgi:hypothetical protein